MIQKLGQVMVYVKHQDEALAFWTEKAGFSLIDEQKDGDMRWIEVAPSHGAETSIVLHDKELIANMEPEMNLGTPSLMFFTDDVERLFQDFKNKKITVGELVDTPSGKLFNFADHEENYFAVMEKKG